jgi:hypothetical protein
LLLPAVTMIGHRVRRSVMHHAEPPSRASGLTKFMHAIKFLKHGLHEGEIYAACIKHKAPGVLSVICRTNVFVTGIYLTMHSNVSIHTDFVWLVSGI